MHDLKIMEKVDIPLHLRESIPWLLWGIWKARNSTLYANKVNDHHLVIANALEETREWFMQQSQPVLANGILTSSHNFWNRRWIRPPVGVLKCNVHASWV